MPAARGAFTLGPVHAEPGTVARGLLPIAQRADGSPIGIPLVVVHGAEHGPVLCVDAAAHGDEQEGSIAVLRLLRTIDPATLRGTLVTVPALHVPAMEALHRANPTDHWHGDLNRQFPGQPEGNLTQRVAHAYVDQVASRANAVISLHSGASYMWWSYQGVIGTDPASRELGQLLGEDWDILWEDVALAGTCRAACAERGIPQVTLEVAGAGDRALGRFEEHTGRMVEAICNVMRHKGMIDGTPTTARRWTVVRTRAVRSARAGLIEPHRDLRPRTFVRAGTPLLHLYDFFGQDQELVRAPVDGYVMGIRSYPYAPPGWPLVWMGVVTEEITDQNR